jgi:hypothetical protein
MIPKERLMSRLNHGRLVVVHGAETFVERASKAKKRMVGSATIPRWLSPPIETIDSEKTAGSAACQDQPSTGPGTVAYRVNPFASK